MTTVTMTLVEFLTARLDEDERIAHEADEAGEWFTRTDPRTWTVHGTKARVPVADTISYRVAPHIARHDPARVLREVEAKRAIVARCQVDATDAANGTAYDLAREVLGDLASIYSDHHPDYREEWRP